MFGSVHYLSSTCRWKNSKKKARRLFETFCFSFFQGSNVSTKKKQKKKNNKNKKIHCLVRAGESWSCQLQVKGVGHLGGAVSLFSSSVSIHSYSSSPGSSVSSSSSVCSGTRFWPAALSDLRVLPPPGAGPWSGTCCKETPSPAPGSGVWCTDTFSSEWTWRGSSWLMDFLKGWGGTHLNKNF